MLKKRGPRKPIHWLGLETEIRNVLANYRDGKPGIRSSPALDTFAEDALACIDEIIARHTRRGNELEHDDKDLVRLDDTYPNTFKDY